MRRLAPIQQYLAVGRADQAVQTADHRRLSTSRKPHYHEGLARPHLERGIVDAYRAAGLLQYFLLALAIAHQLAGRVDPLSKYLVEPLHFNSVFLIHERLSFVECLLSVFVIIIFCEALPPTYTSIPQIININK